MEEDSQPSESFRKELGQRLRNLNQNKDQAQDEVDFDLTEPSNRTREQPTENLKIREYPIFSHKDTPGGPLADPTQPLSRMYQPSSDEDSEDLRQPLQPITGRSSTSSSQHSDFHTPGTATNRGAIQFIVDKVPQKYQTSKGVSILGLVCTVAQNYGLTLQEEEALARHLQALAPEKDQLDVGKLGNVIQGDIGIYSVREASRLIYESRIQQALDRVRISGQIFEEAETFYSQVKNAEASLAKQKSAVKSQINKARNRLLSMAENMVSSVNRELVAKVTDIEKKVKELEKRVKGMVSKERFSYLGLKLEKSQGREKELLELVEKEKKKVRKLKKSLTKIEAENGKLIDEKQEQNMDDMRDIDKVSSSFISIHPPKSRGSKAHDYKAVAPKSGSRRSVSRETNCLHSNSIYEEKIKHQSTQTLVGSQKKTLIKELEKLCTTVAGRSYLLFVELFESDFEITPKIHTKFAKDSPLVSYMVDSNLFENLLGRQKFDEDYIRLSLKVMLDRIVKSSDTSLLHRRIYQDSILWLASCALDLKHESLTEQAVILVEKVSSIEGCRKADVKSVARCLEEMIDGDCGKWRENEFLRSNLKIIKLNLHTTV